MLAIRAVWMEIHQKTHSQLEKFLEAKSNQHKVKGNPNVRCNVLYRTRDNVNAHLTATRAISLPQQLLPKAQLILGQHPEDAAVHALNQGPENETVYFGLTKARKGPRRPKKI